MKHREIEYVFVKSELGAGTFGASLGIEAMQLAANNRESNIFDRYPGSWLEDESVDKDWPPYAHNIHTLVPLYGHIAYEVQQKLVKRKFPFICSGDHSNAGGTLAGLRAAYPNKRIGVIWVDAHADIHTPWTTPSGNMHGMPIAASLGMELTPEAHNTVDADTQAQWQALLQAGGHSPKILAQDLVFIGIRDLEDAEWAVIRREGICHFTPEQVHQQGIPAVAKAAVDYLKACDVLYVSFDVDAMDDTLVQGTGTPVPNGLTLVQTKQLLQLLWKEPKLAAFEITEVNPLLDTKNKTAEIACDILISLLG